MTLQEFQVQIGRLVEQFGKGAYPQVRAELIWREIKDLSPWWFEKAVDQFIGSLRQPPLMQEFREEISKERERLWRIEKEQNSKDAKDFFQGVYQPDDVKTICLYISKRLRREVSDQDYLKFLEHLTSSSNYSLPKRYCSVCMDSGLVFKRHGNGCEYVYRCNCEHGSKRPKAYPVWEDRS